MQNIPRHYPRSFGQLIIHDMRSQWMKAKYKMEVGKYVGDAYRIFRLSLMRCTSMLSGRIAWHSSCDPRLLLWSASHR